MTNIKIKFYSINNSQVPNAYSILFKSQGNGEWSPN